MVPDWKLIPAAFDMGINFFFVSTDMHWPHYEASRRGLKALFASRKRIRDEVVIAGVCYPTQPEFMSMPFDELVDAVPGMTRVDVLVAGGSYGADILPRAATLRRLAEPKHARAVGASFHDRKAAVWAANYQLVDLCFIRYNPAHPGARYDLFPKLLARHPPLYNFNSMGGFVAPDKLRSMNLDPSMWRPEATDYYRYALSRPQMAGLLFTVKQRQQLTKLDAATTKGPLTPVEEEHLEQLTVLAQRSSAAQT